MSWERREEERESDLRCIQTGLDNYDGGEEEGKDDIEDSGWDLDSYLFMDRHK